jgi:hypothetical protein
MQLAAELERCLWPCCREAMGEGASFVPQKKGAVTSEPAGTETTITVGEESVSSPLLGKETEVRSSSPSCDVQQALISVESTTQHSNDCGG